MALNLRPFDDDEAATHEFGAQPQPRALRWWHIVILIAAGFALGIAAPFIGVGGL